MEKEAEMRKEATYKRKKKRMRRSNRQREKEDGGEGKEAGTTVRKANKVAHTGSPRQVNHPPSILRGCANFVPTPISIQMPVTKQDLDKVNMDLD